MLLRVRLADAQAVSVERADATIHNATGLRTEIGRQALQLVLVVDGEAYCLHGLDGFHGGPKHGVESPGRDAVDKANVDVRPARQVAQRRSEAALESDGRAARGAGANGRERGAARVGADLCQERVELVVVEAVGALEEPRPDVVHVRAPVEALAVLVVAAPRPRALLPRLEVDEELGAGFQHRPPALPAQLGPARHDAAGRRRYRGLGQVATRARFENFGSSRALFVIIFQA